MIPIHCALAQSALAHPLCTVHCSALRRHCSNFIAKIALSTWPESVTAVRSCALMPRSFQITGAARSSAVAHEVIQ